MVTQRWILRILRCLLEDVNPELRGSTAKRSLEIPRNFPFLLTSGRRQTLLQGWSRRRNGSWNVTRVFWSRWNAGRKEGRKRCTPWIIMISGSTDDVRRGPRGGQAAVDPLLRYLSHSASRLMHNLLRAFNNANHLADTSTARLFVQRVPANRSSASSHPHISPMFWRLLRKHPS